MNTSGKKSVGYVPFRNIRLVLLVFFLLVCGVSLLKAQTDPYTKITDDMSFKTELAMEDDYIVYAKKSDMLLEHSIVLYTISTGEEIVISDPGHMDFNNLEISGDRIVWAQKETGQWDIYNYLISRPDLGAYPLITNEGDQLAPAIHENTLVWVNSYNGKSRSVKVIKI